MTASSTAHSPMFCVRLCPVCSEPVLVAPLLNSKFISQLESQRIKIVEPESVSEVEEKAVQEQHVTIVPCSECGEPAMQHCDDCKADFCSAHVVEAHKLKAQRGHLVMSLESKATILAEQGATLAQRHAEQHRIAEEQRARKCPNHLEENAHHYCPKHKQTCCAVCSLPDGEHEGCPLRAVKTAAAIVKSEQAKMVAGLGEEVGAFEKIAQYDATLVEHQQSKYSARLHYANHLPQPYAHLCDDPANVSADIRASSKTIRKTMDILRVELLEAVTARITALLCELDAKAQVRTVACLRVVSTAVDEAALTHCLCRAVCSRIASRHLWRPSRSCGRWRASPLRPA